MKYKKHKQNIGRVTTEYTYLEYIVFIQLFIHIYWNVGQN